MKLKLKPREGYIHTSDRRKCCAYKHTFYDCLNPEVLCKHLKYEEHNIDGFKLYYVGWMIFYGSGSQYSIRDIKYCPYCGEKIEYKIV